MVVGRINRCIHYACHTGHTGGDTKHNSEFLININTEQANGFPVSHTGSYYHAKGGKTQERKHSKDNQTGKCKIHQPPVRISNRILCKTKVDTDIERTYKCIRCRSLDRVSAIKSFDDFLQYNRKAKGH